MRSPQLIAVALVLHRGLILVGRRPEHKPLAGYWEFPGGKVERNESVEAAAVRECHEETSIEVKSLGCCLCTRQCYEHAVVRLHFVICEVLGEVDDRDAVASPAKPFRWVEMVRLREFQFPEGNHDILAYLAARC